MHATLVSSNNDQQKKICLHLFILLGCPISAPTASESAVSTTATTPAGKYLRNLFEGSLQMLKTKKTIN